MAPKIAKGGRGQSTILSEVRDWRAARKTPDEIRHMLRQRGYKAPRIAELIKSTNPQKLELAEASKAAASVGRGGGNQTGAEAKVQRKPAVAEDSFATDDDTASTDEKKPKKDKKKKIKKNKKKASKKAKRVRSTSSSSTSPMKEDNNEKKSDKEGRDPQARPAAGATRRDVP